MMRSKPKVASNGDAVEAPVKPGDKAPPKPEHGAAPVFYSVKRDVPEPKLRVPPMPERLWTDSDESYKARVGKWAAAKDKARIVHEERLRVYHAGPKVRVEQVARWTRNPVAPALPEARPTTAAPLSFEDKVTRLCVALLAAEQATPIPFAHEYRVRMETQALSEAGHSVVVAANMEGMLSGKALTVDGREHALASAEDLPARPTMPQDKRATMPEKSCCPICGHLSADFRAHLQASHRHPAEPKKAPAAKKAAKAPAKKAAAKKTAKKAAKPTNPGKEENAHG